MYHLFPLRSIFQRADYNVWAEGNWIQFTETKYFFYKILFSAHLGDANLFNKYQQEELSDVDQTVVPCFPWFLTNIDSVNLKVHLHCEFFSTFLRQYCICSRMSARPIFAIVCVICSCNHKPGYSEDICLRNFWLTSMLKKFGYHQQHS